FRRLVYEFNCAREILLRVRATAHLDERDLRFLSASHSESFGVGGHVRVFKAAACRRTPNYFTDSAGTTFTLSITTRFVGLLGSPCAFRSTGVLPIFSSTSSPLINLPKVVYCPSRRRTGARQMKNCEPAESGSGPRAIEITPRSWE